MKLHDIEIISDPMVPQNCVIFEPSGCVQNVKLNITSDKIIMSCTVDRSAITIARIGYAVELESDIGESDERTDD